MSFLSARFFHRQLNQLLFALGRELLSGNDRGVDMPLTAGFPDAWLFAAARQAVIIVELAGNSIVEVNPAAAALLESERSQLLGSSFPGAFAADSTPALLQLIARTRVHGHSERLIARTRGTRAASGIRLARWARSGRDIAITMSMVSADAESYLLVRLLPATRAGSDESDGSDDDVPSLVLHAIEQAPEGFVVTDLELRLSYANRAFIAMAGLESLAQLQGKSLAAWLELSQADLMRLNHQMARRQAVTVWKTKLRRSNLSIREAMLAVEVSAIAVPDGRERSWGFRISAEAQSAAG